MSYQVLARKWRPRTFHEVVGQEHVLRALINALDHQRLHHAYLFAGTRGVGKTTLARIFAKALNCERGISSTPCGECSICTDVDQGRFVDLIEVDAASRTKVEDTRDLLDNVQYLPARGRIKVYLIDEVHMLSNSSFNALLKTLEEPPEHVKFLLATTDPQRLPVTVLSRCLQFNLKRLSVERMASHVQTVLTRENIPFDASAPVLIAANADGSLRDALSLLDQAIAYGGGTVRDADVRTMLGTVSQDHVYDVVRAVIAAEGRAVLAAVEVLTESAVNFSQVLDELLSLFHHIAVRQVVPDARVNGLLSDAVVAELAQTVAAEDLQLFYQIGALGKRDFALAPDPRTALEMTLLRMIAFRPDTVAEVAIPADKPAPRVIARDREDAASKVSPTPTRIPTLRASVAAMRAESIQTPDSIPAPAVAEPAPMVYAKPALAWPDLVRKLALDGLVRQLAANCAPLIVNADRVELLLAPSHKSLLSPKLEDRLRAALEQHFGQPVVVKITVSEKVPDTPAQQDVRARDERQKAAQRDIAEDVVVRGIVDTFNGRVLQESITPLPE